jgi:hypothetical protein
MYIPPEGKLWNPFTGREISINSKNEKMDDILIYNHFKGWYLPF